MKLKLIAPARKSEWGEVFWDLRALCKFTRAKAPNAPLSLLTIAALAPKEFEVEVVDENVCSIDFSEPADLVGISFFTALAPRAYEIASEYRERGTTVVLGGIHASMVPDEALRHADCILIGEAEETWQVLLRDFANDDLKPIYKQDGFPDITHSPIPLWNLIDEKDYFAFSVQTSRGCPNNCDFCSVTLFNGRKVRHKAVSRVIEEISYLKEVNPRKTIFFVDDNLLADKQYALQLFHKLDGMNVRWMCQSSINKLGDKKTLKLMYEAGCRQIFVGFESVFERSLIYMNKSKVNKLADYQSVIDKVHSAGITICGSFILGGDGDRFEVFRETFDFASKTDIPFSMINVATPFPGTNLYVRLEKQGRITCKEWHKYDGENLCFEPSFMDPILFMKERNKLIRQLYSYRNLLKRLKGLQNKGALTRGKSKLVTKGRLLVTLSVLKTSPRNWLFAVRSLWNPKKTSVMAVVMAISLNRYSKEL